MLIKEWALSTVLFCLLWPRKGFSLPCYHRYSTELLNLVKSLWKLHLRGGSKMERRWILSLMLLHCHEGKDMKFLLPVDRVRLSWPRPTAGPYFDLLSNWRHLFVNWGLFNKTSLWLVNHWCFVKAWTNDIHEVLPWTLLSTLFAINSYYSNSNSNGGNLIASKRRASQGY